MADNPPGGIQYQFTVALFSFAAPGKFQGSATLAAGDALHYVNNVLIGNLTTLPVVTPGGSKLVLVTVTAGEMVSGARVGILLSDPGDEWGDFFLELRPT